MCDEVATAIDTKSWEAQGVATPVVLVDTEERFDFIHRQFSSVRRR